MARQRHVDEPLPLSSIRPTFWIINPEYISPIWWTRIILSSIATRAGWSQWRYGSTDAWPAVCVCVCVRVRVRNRSINMPNGTTIRTDALDRRTSPVACTQRDKSQTCTTGCYIGLTRIAFVIDIKSVDFGIGNCRPNIASFPCMCVYVSLRFCLSIRDG